LDEINQSNRMGLVLEEEVNTLSNIFNIHGFFCCSTSDKDLLKQHERSLMIDILSNLDRGHPNMWSKGFLAIFALKIYDFELDHELLLEQSFVHDFFLDC